MFKIISKKTAKLLRKYDQSIDQEKEEILVYGLEILTYEVSMILVVFLIGFILGIEFNVLCSVASFSFVRFLASGVHAKTRLICATTYLASIYFSTLLPIYLLEQYINKLVLLFYCLNMIFLLKYAPGDTEENPMTDQRKIKFKKIASIVVVNILFLVSFIIKENPVIANTIVISSTLASCYTTPFMYKIFGCKRSENII